MSFSQAYSMKNNEVTLTNCDREPVHVPGCIQPFGALLSIQPKTYIILQVSDNVAHWFGKSPDALLNKPLSLLIGQDNLALLQKFEADDRLEQLPRYIFTLSTNGHSLDFLCHQHQDMIILECEQTQTTVQETLYNDVNRVSAKLMKTVGLKQFAQTLANEIRSLTGLDRVMIYRFHEDFSGEVFAEAKRDDLHTYLTLRYPAEDIPHPAREIFKKIWVRPVPNVDYKQSEIIPLINPVSQKPLDMTYSFLRGASVMYTDYLKNMEVAMALTLSIVVDGKLWGLVACHHNTPKMIAWPIRAACELLAQIGSLQLKSAENAQFSAYREQMESTSSKIIEEMIQNNRLVSNILTDDTLSGFVNASGTAVLENDTWTTHGLVPTMEQLSYLASNLKEKFHAMPTGTHILHTQSLTQQLPEAETYANIASGVLAMSISRNHDDMVLWFRPELVQTVNWAGDPYTKPIENSAHGPRLMPRSSFALWQESVRAQSEPWKMIEIEAAKRLREALIEVIVARTQNIKRLNSELEISNTELDAFAYVTSHDLREPLRGIYHYAYYLKENAEKRTDQEAILQLDSLMRLTKRMDGLIESLLHFSRLGRTELEIEKVNMKDLIEEAVDILYARIKETNPQITVQPHFPFIQVDAILVREIWTNLINNALKYNDKDRIEIEIGMTQTDQGQAYFIKDNGIGIPPDSHETIFQIFKRLHAKNQFGGGSGAGLSIVRRVIERHDGKIWLESTPGVGTTFYFTLGSAENV